VRRIAGVPVSPAAYGDRGEAHGAPRLAEALEGRVLELGLDAVRGDGLGGVLATASLSHDYVICDAETGDDLLRVGSALGVLLDRVVVVGSYGLAAGLRS